MAFQFGLPADVGQPACSDPEALPLVDASFVRSGGPEAQQLKRDFCSRCEISAECLSTAMRDGEYGAWGGTSQKARTQHGSPSPNMKKYHNRAS